MGPPGRESSGAWQGRDGARTPLWTLPPTSALGLCNRATEHGWEQATPCLSFPAAGRRLAIRNQLSGRGELMELIHMGHTRLKKPGRGLGHPRAPWAYLELSPAQGTWLRPHPGTRARHRALLALVA